MARILTYSTQWHCEIEAYDPTYKMFKVQLGVSKSNKKLVFFYYLVSDANDNFQMSLT